MLWPLFLLSLFSAGAFAKELPLAGETFSVNGREAFLIAPPGVDKLAARPWVLYAPTLPKLPGPEETWMFQQFLAAGMAVAGIDVGESYGSPAGRQLFSALHTEMTARRGYSPRAVLLGRSRGGLMALAWAVEHPELVAGFAGIYPVTNLLSYPGLEKAAGAYEMTAAGLSARLYEHNPVERLTRLAKARVPLFAIHGEVDKLVPLEANSALMKERYEAMGGEMELIVPAGQGHNMWRGFFESEALVNFVKRCARTGAAAGRPRIGLALAGGSALGLAHVGVLKWLDEHRVPVDAVAGASMGALVGGMFAAGAEAAEIVRFLSETDWPATLQPTTPFSQLAFRRKEDRRDFPNQLEFGLRGGQLQFPVALSAGHGVGLVISRIAAPYASLDSFDSLPTPFRCVATDLAAAKRVEFAKGDLFEALRASMALPGLFAPVTRQGGREVLVDGGIIDNLPVDVTRKMGAEIVIAVGLHVPLPQRGNQYSLFGVFDRSIDIMLSGTELRAMAKADVVIVPDLTGFASGDFHRAAEFIERGYQAAAAKANLLKRLALPEAEWQAYREQRRARRRAAQPAPEFIVAEGLTKPLEKNLQERMADILEPPFNRRHLERELTRLTGLGRWDTASYRFIERDGKQGLLIRAQEKPHGPPFLNTALLIDGANSQTMRFGIGGRLTFLDFGNPGSEWRTDFGLGFRDTLGTEYFHRVRSSKFFIAPRAFIDRSQRDLFERNDRVARFSTREMGAGLDIGFAAGRFTEWRLGYQLSQFQNAVSIGVPSLPSLRGNVSRVRMKWTREGQDSAIVATRGIRWTSNAQWIFRAPGADAGGGFPMLDGDLRWAQPLGPASPYVLTGQFAGGATLSTRNVFAPYTLGGPLRMSALAPQQLFGSHFYFSEIGVLRALSRRPTQYFARMYLMGGYEMGSAFNTGDRARPLHGGVAGIVGETPIGVLFVGGGYGEQGQRKLFVRLGRFF
ncbi:MAG: patatin-like phospholipase family protein [Bryobacterales bacterium]|nr:patatin-like phospholipase family protein [Bryobacterales bacterium]